MPIVRIEHSVPFDSVEMAETFLRTMQRIWGGPGKAVMLNPSGRIADIVETKEL